MLASCGPESSIHRHRLRVTLQLDQELESVAPCDRPLVLALVHCPPEQLQLGFPYHAVPAGGWDCVFCDALSLDDAIVTVPQEGSATSSLARAPAAKDPRRWAAVGFGLLERPTTADARVEFAGVFDEALRTAIEGVKTATDMAADRLKARGVTATAKLYAARSLPKAQVDLAMDVFQKRPYLRGVLLDCFVNVLTETLQRTVRNAGVALLSGQSVKGGMLEMVRKSLKWLLKVRVRRLTLFSCVPRATP
jgi:hypothetical protein